MLSLSGFRDAISKLSLRKKLTILISVGVLLPILLLTYLQYRSLAELQTKTKGAFKDNLRQGLPFVEQQMKQRLVEIAAKTLNPIGSMDLSSQGAGASEKLDKHLAGVKSTHPEIEEMFVFGYPDAQQKIKPEVLFLYDKARMAQSFVDSDRRYLFVPGMHDGAYLFYPLPDQRGVAGVFLSKGFVSYDLLAGSINNVSKIYHGNAAVASALVITITDENGQVLFSNAVGQNEYFLESNFDRAFSN